MRTVIAGFLFIFCLPFLFHAVASVVILAALAALAYGLFAISPLLVIAISFRQLMRRAN